MPSAALVSLSRHTLRQLKFILPGALVTFYLGSHRVFWEIVTGEVYTSGWGRTVAWVTLCLSLITVSLFMYILLLPSITGETPNYRQWKQSGVLSSVIPVLTTSIILGWSLLSYTLAHFSNLGVIEGLIASSGLYALAFGLMGLIPAPRVRR